MARSEIVNGDKGFVASIILCSNFKIVIGRNCVFDDFYDKLVPSEASSVKKFFEIRTIFASVDSHCGVDIQKKPIGGISIILEVQNMDGSQEPVKENKICLIFRHRKKLARINQGSVGFVSSCKGFKSNGPFLWNTEYGLVKALKSEPLPKS